MMRIATRLAVLAAAIGPGLLAAQPPRDSSPLPAPPATPGAWNDSASLALVTRATTRRQAQLADTALRDYRALARGFLTFLGQVGEGLSEPPRVIQATQVATEVYWRAPNLSKQRVVGMRDTTVLPTDNDFYRDRYQIVQNNFPELIRVGEGRDVADVPHPLSARGLGEYDFAVRDSLGIRVGDRTLSVIEVQVRPRDPRAPRLVGTLFLDRDDAQVVRMAFTFTRAAYLDQRNEDVSIVLENALVQGRFWLPRRQEVEVRRTGTWLDFPARGIIRGRWEIGDYAVNQGIALAQFAGPELTFAPYAEQRRYPFGAGSVLDSLPGDVRAVSDEDVRRVQAQARALVQREVLARARGARVAARRISDFARVNRVEGIALGAGYRARLGGGVSVGAQGRFGFSAERLRGRAFVAREWAGGSTLRLAAYDDFREAGDEPETSMVRNSLAAQEFGSDYTDPYATRGASLGVDLAPRAGFRPAVEVAWEEQRPLAVRARPFSGRYEGTIHAAPVTALRLAMGVERALAAAPFGTEVRLRAEARTSVFVEEDGCGAVRFVPPDTPVPTSQRTSAECGLLARGALALGVERAFGAGRLVTHTTLAAVNADAPAQDRVYLGGPVTGPGYRFHELVGRFGASQRVEWRAPVPFPSLSLGRYGRSPANATLAPYAHTMYVAGRSPRYDVDAPAGWFPSIGVGAYVFFDLVRVDVARGLRDGRWTFGLDVTRDFWRVL